VSENFDVLSALFGLKISNTANVIFLAIQKPQEVSSCDFYAFAKRDGIWQLLFETDGFIGSNGIKDPERRTEGDGTTPAGVYSFGMLFGIKDAPEGLKKQYKKLDEDDYWDGDTQSDTYNQYVKGCEMPKSWNIGASEHLIDYKESYNFAAQINFNVNPTVKGRGSAIFMHCIRKGAVNSAGCIAVEEDKMRQALKLIDDNSFIVIVKDVKEIINFY